MDAEPDLNEERRCRAAAAADIMVLALERNLPHMALPAAREAARSALLALAAGPRVIARQELDVLREMAACPPGHLAGRPADREARIRATLAVLLRLFEEARPLAGRTPPDAAGGCGDPRPHSHARAA